MLLMAEGTVDLTLLQAAVFEPRLAEVVSNATIDFSQVCAAFSGRETVAVYF